MAVIRLLVACLALGFPGDALSATLHVPSEFGTITEALEVAAVGDSVLVASGYYHEIVVVPPGVTLLSVDLHQAVISGPPDQAANRVIFGGTGDPQDAESIVEGFRITAGDDFSPPPVVSYNANSIVQNCRIYAGGPALWLDPIVYMKYGGTVRFCEVDGGRSSNMFLSTADGAVLRIEDCILGRYVFANSMDGFGSGSQTIFDHCTLNNPQIICSLQLPDESDFEIRFQNCIIWSLVTVDCGTSGHVPDDLEFRYTFWHGGNILPFSGCPESANGPGNIEGDDPLFCEEPGKEWWLTPDSPCIGAGEDGDNLGARLGVCGVTSVDEDASVGFSYGDEPRLVASYRPGRSGILFQALGFESGHASVELTDVGGRVLHQSEVRIDPQGEGFFGTPGGMASGVFFLRVDTGEHSTTTRLVVVN